MSVHRTLDGGWAECSNANCALKFHFSNMTVAEAEQTPLSVLLPLLEIIDPPNVTIGWEKQWHDGEDQLHRDYDLPAQVFPDSAHWYQHGKVHRAGDKPARIWPSRGDQEWYQDGEPHRLTGPALISHDGREHYWLNGTEITRQQWLKSTGRVATP